MSPRDHTIHLGVGDSPVSSPQNNSIANLFVLDPKVDPNRSLAQHVDLEVPNSDPGSNNPPKGVKIQKMRTAILCNTPFRMLQTDL